MEILIFQTQCHPALFNTDLCDPTRRVCASCNTINLVETYRCPGNPSAAEHQAEHHPGPESIPGALLAAPSHELLARHQSARGQFNVIVKHADTVEAFKGQNVLFGNFFNGHTYVCQHLLKAWMSASSRLAQKRCRRCSMVDNAYFASSCWVASCFLSSYSFELKLLPYDTGR